MKRFADLDEYLSGEAEPGLLLPIGGRNYVISPPDGLTGLWCERVIAVAGKLRGAETADDVEAAAQAVDELPDVPGGAATLAERVLGPAHAEMLAGGVDHVRIRIAAMTALLWIVSGEDAAQQYWEAGGRPEALRPGNRAERRASTRTGEAGTTPRQGSGSGTSHRPNSSPARRGRRSRGQRS